MDADIRPLLQWDRLVSTEPQIPWEVLEEFARALPSHGGVMDRLLDLYEQFQKAPYERESYESVYIPAIMVKAAPDLPPEIKAQLARVMVCLLVEADKADDAVMGDVLEIAIGAMGPDAAVSAILEIMPENITPSQVPYAFWHLMVSAKDARDASLRERVVELCTKALEMAKSDQIDIDDAEHAAWVLARIGHFLSRPLIQRLYVKTQYPELLYDLELLDGKEQWPPEDDLWNAPFEEWVEENCDCLRDWYLHGDQEDQDDLDDDGEVDEEADEEKALERIDALVSEFYGSARLADLPEQKRDDYCSAVFSVLEYAWRYEDAGAEGLTKSVLHEVLLDVLPRKMSAQKEYYENLSPATQLFLEWLETKGILADTAPLRKAVGKWHEEIVQRGMDPRNWGMAKSFAMAALEAGVDLTDNKAMEHFTLEYNRKLQEQYRGRGGPFGGLDPDSGGEYSPEGYRQPADDYLAEPVTAPIVSDKTRTGRNDPCPCGSGKKFKKCCLKNE